MERQPTPRKNAPRMPATSRFWNENKAVFAAENFDFCTEREVICKYCKRNSFFGLRFDPESQEEFTIADLEQNFYAKTTLGTRAMICCYIDNRSKSDVYYSVKVVYLPGDLAA